ncbi:LCP family protein [Enterococcus sp. DIV0660C]|uniref:LCP family glycopolymer transferase n=1 Tax=Enterococcus sp. DIV0660C TaxID=2230880 RepID=UPI001F5C2372|nr:LCP family protein [Enterococcus sp. DIV0660C]
MRRAEKKRMSTGRKVFLWILSILLIIIAGIAVYAGKIYFDVKSTADKTYATVDRITESKRDKAINYDAGDPFSILLLGVDTGDFGRTDQGRSDSIMVATVNPQKKKTTLVSIPRDTYTEIVGHGTSDKINHAYAFGGVAMSIATVENMLDIPIDHYAEINMKGMQELVDAVGGVDVNNKLTFSYDGTDFPIGKQTLNGSEAVKYARMRYDDPKGDYGRQDRQRQVISGIINKTKSVDTLTNYTNLLDALGNNAATDVSWDTIKVLATNYRDAFSTIRSEQLAGDSFTGDGTTGENGISYQRASSDELARIQKELKEQLK